MIKNPFQNKVKQTNHTFYSENLQTNMEIEIIQEQQQENHQVYNQTIEYVIQDIQQNNIKDNDQIQLALNALLLQNKINQQNAFDVPMPNIIKLKIFQDDSLTNCDQSWSLISNSLETGAKIYGFRVDQVHKGKYL